jgi:hypothetical protein
MCNRSIKKEDLMKMKNSKQEELDIYKTFYSRPFLNEIEGEAPSSWTTENKEKTKKD